MTRETKIGLLVGLAFIIVIGILLSDQLMRSTEPEPAPLANVADTVRKATVTPAPHNAPLVTRAPAPAEVHPENVVLVREEVVTRAPPVTFVEIRPGNSGVGTAIAGPGQGGRTSPPPSAGHSQAPTPPQNALIQTPVRSAAGSAAPTPRQPDLSQARTLADAAAAVGETLIGPDGQPLRASQPAQGPPGHNLRPNPLPAVTMKQYKAEPGDHLSRLATKFFGTNTKAAREAILAANPSLAADPNKIIIGHLYNIPVIDRPTPTPAPAATPASAPAPAPAPSSIENWYTVKSGDSLWRIAAEQCGDKNMAAAIKELNRDTVKDWNKLFANTKIRLPTKPLAASARANAE